MLAGGMEPRSTAPKAIFFDAVGTLLYLPKSVGYHYAHAGRTVGLSLDSRALDAAFQRVWQKMPPRPATKLPRENDDKGWWRELAYRVMEEVAPQTNDLDRDAFFEVAYEHFAEAGVWELYAEVEEVLEQLQTRFQLAVISNFDGRLRMILEQLGLSRFFRAIIISSEVGADKPDSFIFKRALDLAGVDATQALHVGDDPVHDWQGAAAAGLQVFELKRPQVTLRDLVVACAAW